MNRLATTLTALLLAGCATHVPRGAPALADYLPFAGEPVDEFHFYRLDDWQRAGRDHVVLWTDPATAYLVQVAQPCFDLEFTEYLAVSSTLHTVSRFESLYPGRSARCPIAEIRPLDVRRLRAERAARAATVAPR